MDKYKPEYYNTEDYENKDYYIKWAIKDFDERWNRSGFTRANIPTENKCKYIVLSEERMLQIEKGRYFECKFLPRWVKVQKNLGKISWDFMLPKFFMEDLYTC